MRNIRESKNGVAAVRSDCCVTCDVTGGEQFATPRMSTRNISSHDGRELKEIVYPNGDKYVGMN